MLHSPQLSALPVPAPAASPVGAAWERLAQVFPELRVTELAAGEPGPVGGDWVSAAGLARAGAELDAYLRWDHEQIERDYGRTPRPDVVASFGFHRYAWPACLLITLPWLLVRRVPRYGAGDVYFDRPRYRMAVRSVPFACLPDDPEAGHPLAVVVPDEEALRAEVRSAVATHLGPLLDGVGPRMRRRGRALWGMVTDEIVEGLAYVGELLGERARTAAELEALLPGTTKPYVGTPGFRELTGPDGERLPTRDRVSCCLSYTLGAEEICGTCPRLCDAERVARLRAERLAAEETTGRDAQAEEATARAPEETTARGTRAVEPAAA
ncbi:(2Fe-2S)-binding protein [Streptomyces sp. NRRL F-5630]|uniref:(2Fe-2S)-binding protein n=1 Tax=Streptomyces sp. NRRL F-5630 TaxID=1463864 RepID=UPI003D755F22